jgi:hypothetical protein
MGQHGDLLSQESSENFGRTRGLQDMVLLESFDELDYIGAHDIPARSIVATDFVGDERLVVTPLHQFQDLGSDDIQAEHLAVVNVQQNSAIYCLAPPDCVGDSEHCQGVRSNRIWIAQLKATLAPGIAGIQKRAVLFVLAQLSP